MTAELGELVTADLRKAWSHEAHDFTPWLAENLDRLSEVIGLNLDIEGREVQAHVQPCSPDRAPC